MFRGPSLIPTLDALRHIPLYGWKSGAGGVEDWVRGWECWGVEGRGGQRGDVSG